MTDVFFQVRGRGDAFYRSELEPWASELTGTLGRDPGWDPLQTAIEQARARGLRLHAWINTFPMWNGRRPPPPSSPQHIYNAHPGWIMADRQGRTLRLGNRFGYVSASPGNPEVQQHIHDVVMDILSRYPVDGVHFDYIRLPDQDYSYDAVSRGRFLRESIRGTYIQWQAEQITGMLERIAADARRIAPGLVLTAAVVDRYERAVGIFAQDPAAWTAPGVLDYVIPMAYTPRPAEFADIMHGWLEVLSPLEVAAGISLDETEGMPGAVAAQVHRSVMDGVRGHVFFSLQGLDRLAVLASGQAPPPGTGDLYAFLEEVQGMRLAAAEGVETDFRGALPGTPDMPPYLSDAAEDLAQTLPERPEEEEEGARPAPSGGDLERYLLPAVAGLLVAALLLIP
ncbi:MAG: family 10 glycosylhydrolase [bacterium]